MKAILLALLAVALGESAGPANAETARAGSLTIVNATPTLIDVKVSTDGRSSLRCTRIPKHNSKWVARPGSAPTFNFEHSNIGKDFFGGLCNLASAKFRLDFRQYFPRTQFEKKGEFLSSYFHVFFHFGVRGDVTRFSGGGVWRKLNETAALPIQSFKGPSRDRQYAYRSGKSVPYSYTGTITGRFDGQYYRYTLTIRRKKH